MDWPDVPAVAMAATRRARELLPQLPHADGWLDLRTGSVSATPSPDAVRVRKQANYMKPLADAFVRAQDLFGGPSPLAAALAGGALLGGGGYATGSLASRMLPEDYFDRDVLPANLGLLGAGLGALPGLGWGTLKYMGVPGRPGQTFAHRGAGWLSAYPFRKTSAATDALFEKRIPVDAFNAAVWNDVRSAGNPFGTRSPWGDRDQPLGTPPHVAAAASGLVAAASGTSGGDEYVSPWDVAVAAAVSGGKGLLAGLTAGRILGTLAGLQPDQQKQLQRMGMWGGLIGGAIQAAY